MSEERRALPPASPKTSEGFKKSQVKEFIKRMRAKGAPKAEDEEEKYDPWAEKQRKALEARDKKIKEEAAKGWKTK